MKIGFIGLGHMGSAMAANLVKAGHEVTVFNRSPGKAGALVAARRARGGECCRSLPRRGRDHDARGRRCGRRHRVRHRTALIASLAEGAIHISMSTISVGLSKRLAQAHAAGRTALHRRAVFGRPDMAAAAKLFIVAGGDPAAIEACQPLFDAMGQKTSMIGPDASAANLVKLSGNFLQAAAIEALGEAIALVGKAGIDRRAYVDLMTSSVFNLPGLQDLRRPDCGGQVRAGGLCHAARLQGHSPGARRSREPARADALGKLAA